MQGDIGPCCNAHKQLGHSASSGPYDITWRVHMRGTAAGPRSVARDRASKREQGRACSCSQLYFFIWFSSSCDLLVTYVS